MKFFTSEWLSSGCPDAPVDEYRAHYSSIRSKLPAELVILDDTHTLHDARVEKITCSFSDRKMVINLLGWNQGFQFRVRYALRFEGVADFEQRLPIGGKRVPGEEDLLHWEYDLVRDDVEMRILFASGTEFKITFRAFEFDHEAVALEP
jgi:hypothetical protein